MRILSSGSDWVTLTNIVQDGQGYAPLIAIFGFLSVVERDWFTAGYRGRQCIETGMKYGTRPREDGRADELLVVPGKQSGIVLGHIEDLQGYRVTRFDLQVTVLLDRVERDLVSKLYDKIIDLKDKGHSPLGRRKISHIRSLSGETLYVGSRKTGKKFFRLYDKSLDVDAEIGLVWRQEVQYGRDLAHGATEWYLAARDNPVAVIDLVCSEFMDATGFSLLPADKTVSPDFSENDSAKTTMTAKLDWLKRCVRPTISLMIEHDLLEEATEALGL